MLARLIQRLPPEWRRRVRRAIAWVRLKVPVGLRLPLGILLICGGFLAILPVFGLWMIPVGIAVASLDIRPLRRRWAARRGLVARLAPSQTSRAGHDGPGAPQEDGMRVLDGTIDGDLTVADAVRITGCVAGSLVLRPGARVHLDGTVGGDATVGRDATLRIAGQVAGTVSCEAGGRAFICGMAGRADLSDPHVVLDGGLVAHRAA
ncbi:hypothetical protein BCF33_1532 [Hasllibacter halocynthiae]|uniref:Cytoskeletal protein CcmA (Bactofilin family) n=1 Tax=Hasllibacter halocynthiae TaxID=595589 RepID=A0A2T0X154_9RHOB|nr:polymer-forming cytoskeletal protein [Hasllibacter halocynthiae]PRY92679.1 hypothetical protein BCF33_1532 [Hasllibacter halocynthiae]